ncbi:MAG: FAD-binding oxidoreductase, partial [Pseudomonadota bacterium]
REQVLGLEVVLADGTILGGLNTMMKNNTGYDLKQLFIGSEGTLGVITRAVLRLRPDTPTCNTALVCFDHFDQVTATLQHMTRALNANLNAFEIIWNDFYHLATNPDIQGSTRAPLPADAFAYAIIESRGAHEESDQLQFMQALETAIAKEIITDAVIAKSDNERAEIWSIRENVDLTLRHQPLFIYDISLPIDKKQSYNDDKRTVLREDWPNVIVYAYGHLADNNLHVTIAPQPQNFINDPGRQPVKIQSYNQVQKDWYEHCNQVVFERLSQLGGSISAEHGIGLLKKQYLTYSRSWEEINTMQLLKKTLDPNHLLNPGKVC